MESVDVSEIERVSAANEWDFWYKNNDSCLKQTFTYVYFYVHTLIYQSPIRKQK